MLIGIICEGRLDSRPLEILVERTISSFEIQFPLSFSVDFKKPYETKGSVYPKLAAAVSTLMQGDRPDILIVHSDVDTYPERKTEISSWIRSNESLIPGIPVATLVVEPHFEDLFIKEKDSVVNYFNLAGHEELPHSNLQPKDRILKIIAGKRDLGEIDFTVLDEEIYSSLVEGFNIGSLKGRSEDYNKFQQELRNHCGNL
ncbi:MAG: hypothetical protein JWL87_440 [Candidatus Adlerbacteria bacterium]|nr:hypothetical protein [Candidatus Adlerbacteria bacterium]